MRRIIAGHSLIHILVYCRGSGSCWHVLTWGLVVFQFTVRYLDFGNSEEREARHLAPLRSEFKKLPFQAIQCSIVCEDHTSFTQPVSNIENEYM